jgi:hypothetical protein
VRTVTVAVAGHYIGISVDFDLKREIRGPLHPLISFLHLDRVLIRNGKSTGVETETNNSIGLWHWLKLLSVDRRHATSSAPKALFLCG